MTDPVNAEDDLVTIVARILEPQAWAALGLADTLAYRSRRTSSLRKAKAALEAVRSTRDGEIERYREALADIASTDEAFVHAHGEAGAVARIVDRASQALRNR